MTGKNGLVKRSLENRNRSRTAAAGPLHTIFFLHPSRLTSSILTPYRE